LRLGGAAFAAASAAEMPHRVRSLPAAIPRVGEVGGPSGVISAAHVLAGGQTRSGRRRLVSGPSRHTGAPGTRAVPSPGHKRDARHRRGVSGCWPTPWMDHRHSPRSPSSVPTGVLLDINLPGADGLAVAEWTFASAGAHENSVASVKGMP
jgi:hypothetical protein